jgi:hypothetical protein
MNADELKKLTTTALDQLRAALDGLGIRPQAQRCSRRFSSARR